MKMKKSRLVNTTLANGIDLLQLKCSIDAAVSYRITFHPIVECGDFRRPIQKENKNPKRNNSNHDWCLDTYVYIQFIETMLFFTFKLLFFFLTSSMFTKIRLEFPCMTLTDFDYCLFTFNRSFSFSSSSPVSVNYSVREPLTVHHIQSMCAMVSISERKSVSKVQLLTVVVSEIGVVIEVNSIYVRLIWNLWKYLFN